VRGTCIKKISFYIVILLVNYLLLELVAYGFYRLKFGDYDRQEMQLTRIRTIAEIKQGPVFTGEQANTEIDQKDIIQKEVIHPYYGYTVDGKTRIEGCTSDSVLECYSRIRVPTDHVFPKRSEDKLIVGILGGSVAVGTIVGTKPLRQYESLLAQLPEYKGREIIVYALAAGGLRQPQQLMMLNYYYSLGAEFDLLISLDGFNDVVIPPTVYQNSGTHPSYPRSWAHRVAGTVSADLVDLLAEKQNLQNQHSSRATLMSNPWFRNSPLSNLLWTLSHVKYLNNLGVVDQSVAELDKRDPEKRDFYYEELGPDYDFTTWEDLHQYSVDMWARSSHLIAAVARANDSKYLHFLQPNQYIEGSKPKMSEAEKKVAFLAKSGIGYGYLYKLIFPRVQKKTAWLEERGIEFHDLTYLYKDVERVLYVDSCCHVNYIGYNMIVEKIVETVHQSNLADQAAGQSTTARALSQ